MPSPTTERPLVRPPAEPRPTSAAEKERFSSGGRSHLLILRGKWGLAIDKAIVWTTGLSLVTAQYAWANGAPYTPTLMLYTVGARTGATRSACLPFFRVGDDLVLRGSNGGGPTDPHWVHNVRANPKSWIRVARRTREARAHVAQGEEWERLYAELCRQSRSTKAYQDMCAPRRLPLVVLRDEARTAR
ncbi:MAG: nitroreductase family deazaflavin-dependent oxidoreductase [Deltaproteobacteria bacterium]|nr:nitroreductase family deazaflavin-dependent oxidoreductase [Deltaproteobacteria bacterium]